MYTSWRHCSSAVCDILQEGCGRDVHTAQVQAEMWALGPHSEFNIVCIAQEQNNTLNDW